MKKDKTFGFKETDAYFTQFQNDMKLDGFKNQSEYLRHLIECQRHLMAFGARDFFHRAKGSTRKLYEYSGDRISVTLNSEKDLMEYLLRVHESYRFLYNRLLYRSDLARELLNIDPQDLDRFFNEQKSLIADEIQEKKLVIENKQ